MGRIHQKIRTPIGISMCAVSLEEMSTAIRLNAIDMRLVQNYIKLANELRQLINRVQSKSLLIRDPIGFLSYGTIKIKLC